MIKFKSRILETETFLNVLYKGKLEDEFEYENDHFCLTFCDGWSKTQPPKAKNFKTIGFYNSIDDVLKQIKNNLNRDVWMQIATNNGRSRNKQDTIYAHSIVLEIDYKNLKDSKQIEELCFKINELQPGLIVHSGNGVHVYFLLDEPFQLTEATRDKFELYGAQLRIIMENAITPFLKDGQKLDSIQDISRILRIPGTVNNKDADNPKPVKLLHCNSEQRYSFDEFCKTIDKLYEKLKIQTVEHHTGSIAKLNGSDIQLTAGLKLSKKLFEKVAAGNKNFEITFNGKKNFPSPSERDQALSNYCWMSGFTPQEILCCIIQCRELLGEDIHLNNQAKYALTIEKSIRDLFQGKAHKQTRKPTLDLKLVLE